jgi:hypothetical protein
MQQTNQQRANPPCSIELEIVCEGDDRYEVHSLTTYDTTPEDGWRYGKVFRNYITGFETEKQAEDFIRRYESLLTPVQ